MAGRPPKVEHVRRAFIREVASAYNLMSDILAMPQSIRAHVGEAMHPKRTRQVIELAFMGLVAAWEEFLDQTLARYVAGAKVQGGALPVPKYGLASSLRHSYELLSRDSNYDPAKHYLKVTNPKWVTQQADFFFSKHPFSCLSAKTELLHHASLIRNRVAHNSTKARADFKATAIHFLQPASGALSQGYCAGDLLLEKVQRHFGQSAAQRGLTHFDAYTELYETLAKQIVP